jgi:hypothetical protein
MRSIILATVAAGVLAGLVSYLGQAPGQADQEVAPIYGIKVPEEYRNWRLISVNRLIGGNLKQVRELSRLSRRLVGLSQAARAAGSSRAA